VTQPREKASGDGAFLVAAVVIAILLLVGGGIGFAVWKSTRSIDVNPDNPDETQIAKNNQSNNPDGKKTPADDKQPGGGGSKLIALSDEDERDIRAKLREEVKHVLKRKSPSTIDGKNPELDITLPPVPKKTIAGLDQKKVDDATSRGLAFLRGTQSGKSGGWERGGIRAVGWTSLCGLTLLECKVPPNDVSVQSAANFVRASIAKIDMNYEVSLAILFLDRLGDPRDRPIIQGLALRLLSDQDEAGGWTYASTALNPQEMCQLFAFLRPNRPLYDQIANPKIGNPNDPFQQLRFLLLSKGLDSDQPKAEPKSKVEPQQIAVGSLDEKLQKLPIVKNRGKRKSELVVERNNRSDNSNTQFVLLALWAARRHGVPVDTALLAGYQRFVLLQSPSDGGWGYSIPPSTNTMTCAGLIGLAIGHGTAPEREGTGAKATVKPALNDPRIQGGLQALARNIGQPSTDAKNGQFPMENLYFLWSVERVAMLFDLDTIGGKDWYGWGAQILVHNQQADGSWKSAPYSGYDPVLDTCFALLFLRRSNLVQDLTLNLRLNTGVRDP
jgi:hypothetical protein